MGLRIRTFSLMTIFGFHFFIKSKKILDQLLVRILYTRKHSLMHVLDMVAFFLKRRRRDCPSSPDGAIRRRTPEPLLLRLEKNGVIK